MKVEMSRTCSGMVPRVFEVDGWDDFSDARDNVGSFPKRSRLKIVGDVRRPLCRCRNVLNKNVPAHPDESVSTYFWNSTFKIRSEYGALGCVKGSKKRLLCTLERRGGTMSVGGLLFRKAAFKELTSVLRRCALGSL